MIAVDTNILVYAHREDSPLHVAAEAKVRELAEALDPWCIPWPCIHEFLAVVTHPRIFFPPSTLPEAIAQVEAWMDSPRLVLVTESESYWPSLKSLLEAGRVAGPLTHDARIAALCLSHGAHVLWTADRDFSRFPQLVTHNPLIAS